MSQAQFWNRNAGVSLMVIALAGASSLEFNAAHAQVVDCSNTFCTPGDQQSIMPI
jgi:hypothetical protein